MPLELPTLDDRSYDDILAELRTRIARYTPEWRPVWNDMNHSDPGITLAQLFAWLSEMMIFRMNRVPELAQVKFLQLLGIELRPAQPARVEITFAVAGDWLEPYVDVPARTQVSASADGPPLVFETERPLRALACALKSVQAYDGAQYEDLTPASDTVQADGEGFAPFGEDTPREGAALVLGLGFPGTHPNAERFPGLTLELAFFRAEPAGGARTRRCGPEATLAYTPAKLQWEGWDGERWTALDALGDETFAFTQSGHVMVRVPSDNRLKPDHVGAYEENDPSGNPQPPLFWLRARLARSQYERPPRLSAVRTNTVPALQAQSVEAEVLGGADGSRNQKFRLANAPVLKGSLRIEIDDGTGARAWEPKDDLLGSGQRDEHVEVNWTSGELRFGDGENGAIPIANPDNPDANIVAVYYRYGGGSRGNVAAGAVKNLLTPVAGLDPGATHNLFAAAAGFDEERFEEAQLRARRALRARERAVTAEDFEHLLEQLAVRRAQVLPLVHPDFPGVKVPGAITAIVVPDSPSPTPTPSDALLRAVCEYLDARRLLTTELFVVGPRYIPVSARMIVVAEDGADPGEVRLAVEAAIEKYLHPLHGGDDGAGWPFGGAIRHSKIMRQVFTAPGVDSVPLLALAVDGEEQPPGGDVRLESYAPHALAALSGADVEVLTRAEYEAAA